jgi:hypothetical protein
MRFHAVCPSGFFASLVLAVALVSSQVAGQDCEVSEDQRVYSPEAAQLEDGEFGWSVDIDGDVAIVGARENAAFLAANGRAFIFRRVEGEWTHEATLEYPTGGGANTEGAAFGWAVAISGDTAVVGAPFDDFTAEDSGRAFVFEFENDEWQLSETLLVIESSRDFDLFGWSVDIDGDFLVVGMPFDDYFPTERGGSARVFARDPINLNWIEVLYALRPSSPQTDAQFGYSVAISGGAVAVGAPRRDITIGGQTYVDAGAAYVFGKDIGTAPGWG